MAIRAPDGANNQDRNGLLSETSRRDEPSLRKYSLYLKKKQEADLCKYDYITLFSVRQCSLKGTSGLAEEQE